MVRPTRSVRHDVGWNAVDARDRGGVLYLHGDLTCGARDQVIAGCLSSTAPGVVVDLAAVVFIDCAGDEALLDARAELMALIGIWSCETLPASLPDYSCSSRSWNGQAVRLKVWPRRTTSTPRCSPSEAGATPKRTPPRAPPQRPPRDLVARLRAKVERGPTDRARRGHQGPADPRGCRPSGLVGALRTLSGSLWCEGGEQVPVGACLRREPTGVLDHGGTLPGRPHQLVGAAE